MSIMNSQRYRPTPAPRPSQRYWPDQTLSQAPRWLSTDLRDGNQALFEPMDSARKLPLFERLCAIGLREIEVGFPAAAAGEWAFVRQLIEERRIPPGVRVSVLTAARADLIERTLAALEGAEQVIVHLYHAIADDFREQVFAIDRGTLIDRVVAAVLQIRSHAEAHPQTRWCLQFSPEHFSSSDLDFALAVCDAVSLAWLQGGERELIINLPATVECCPPHVYADRVEFMHRHLARRERLILSVHPHNDRGCAVAAAEQALLAGAERVEGCLFGHGERTGNVDLVTLALNLHSQGIDPQLDFSDIDSLVRLVESCTGLPVHPRHPYAGDLVYTAFSGSHQDAIRKALHAQRPDRPWQVPYLPIDPADVGRDYRSLVRINSQSGKGGIAHLLEQRGVRLSRRHLIDFSARVKSHAELVGGEIDAEQIWQLFRAHYIDRPPVWRLLDYELTEAGRQISLHLEHNGQRLRCQGTGLGPLDAAVEALQQAVEILAYSEFALSAGSAAEALALIEARYQGQELYAAGIASNLLQASLLALLNILNGAEGLSHQPG